LRKQKAIEMSARDEADQRSEANSDDRRPQTPARYAYASEGLDIIDLSRALRNGRWIIVASTLVGALFAYAAIQFTTPAFVVETTLLPALREDVQPRGLSGLGGVAGLVGLAGGAPRETTEALAVLKSRRFAFKFFDDQKALPHLLADQWDAENRRWKPATRSAIGRVGDALGLASARFGPRQHPDLELALKRLNRSRNISVDQDSGMVTIAVTWTDPVTARDWANAMVRLLNAEMRQLAITNSRKRVNYLRTELAKTQVASIRQVLTDITANELQKAMIANVDRDFAFRIVDPAIAPLEAAKPRRFVLLLTGIVGGMLTGIVGVLFNAYLRELRRSKAATRDALRH
jgi:uncharacterized protein involved in exopolysaccharide biosynthesis